MKLSEWIEVQAMIVAWWPNHPRPTADQIKLQHVLVTDVDYGRCKDVVAELARSGAEHPPKPGWLAMNVLTAGMDALGAGRPTFDEAYQLLFGPSSRVLRHDEWDGVHPLVRSFAIRQGLDRLRTLGVDCPDYGEIRRRDLHAAWDAHCSAMEGRELKALTAPAGDRPAVLKQLDPLAALGLAGQAQLEETTSA